MTRRWVLLSCVLLLGSAENLEATPLDSPDIVYIDGLPCNSLCQSYMALSRQSSSAQPLPKAVIHREMAIRGESSPRDANMAASAAAIDPDLLVALVMARPEMKSISDLANKNVAIDGEPSASNGSVRAAIVAAGAAEAQLSKGEAKAIDRLIAGEVPAAVLTLVSPEAAEAFPDIAGFRIFRIPLSPKARL